MYMHTSMYAGEYHVEQREVSARLQCKVERAAGLECLQPEAQLIREYDDEVHRFDAVEPSLHKRIVTHGERTLLVCAWLT